VALAIVAALAGGAYLGLRQVYFLGADDGRLALYRGLPYDLPLGVNLYSQVYSSAVSVDSLPRDRRESATDHTLRSHSDAVSLVEDLEGAAAAPPEAQAQGGGRTSGGKGGSTRKGSRPADGRQG
jgi:protein phosphatase